MQWTTIAVFIIFFFGFSTIMEQEEAERKQAENKWLEKHFPEQVPTCFINETCTIKIVSGKAYIHPSGKPLDMNMSDLDPSISEIKRTPDGVKFED